MSDREYRPLGASGLMVSTVGLGCNNFGRAGTATETQEGTTAVIDAAEDLGVTLLDTADIYGGEGTSETLMGHALKGRRDRFVLATKFGHADIEMDLPHWGAKGSRHYIRAAVEASLTRLQTDRIDLYQLHTPDPITPVEETIHALDDLVREGKILYYGHSNLAGWQIAEAALVAERLGGGHFVSAQDEYSLLRRRVEDEVLPAVRRFGLGFLPYFPLYNGLLTGKFTRDERPADSRIARQRPHLADEAPWDVLEAYRAFCDDRGITMLQATFGWLLAQPSLTSVIAGATRPEQLRQNAEAAAWHPDAAEEREISRLFAR